jgi:hypothetical protein
MEVNGDDDVDVGADDGGGDDTVAGVGVLTHEDVSGVCSINDADKVVALVALALLGFNASAAMCFVLGFFGCCRVDTTRPSIVDGKSLGKMGVA